MFYMGTVYHAPFFAYHQTSLIDYLKHQISGFLIGRNKEVIFAELHLILMFQYCETLHLKIDTHSLLFSIADLTIILANNINQIIIPMCSTSKLGQEHQKVMDAGG